MSKAGWFVGGTLAGTLFGGAAKKLYQIYTSRRMRSMGFPPFFPVPRVFRWNSRQHDAFPFGSMAGSSPVKPSLKSVSLKGELCGLFFKSVIRQEYANESDETLEIIYTFPLAWRNALLGMSVELNGKKMSGIVVEKSRAEEQYEESIQEGDGAVLLQESGPGLYTVNLGNIKPGETLAVEIDSAQLLRLEQGRVRLCIPTVIGERYGDAHETGELAPHESVAVDPAARYPFSLNIDVTGELAGGAISSPSHEIMCRTTEKGVHVTLGEGAALDRDFILLMEGVSADSMAQYVESDDEFMLLTAFSPKLPEQSTRPVALKVLIDCSGSMSGESMMQARKGLGRLVSLLKPEDHISYSQFGSDVCHHIPDMLPCTPASMKKISELIEKTDADLGGTEMEKALASTFAEVSVPQRCESQPTVLLITDGDVWGVEDIIKAARKSGHRVFAVGVGSAPAESLLRELAEQTGGACELVTPQESIEEAIVRMFCRMRGAVASKVRMEWQEEPVWQSSLPGYLYDGETAYCWAVLKHAPSTAPVIYWDAQGKTVRAQAAHLEHSQDQALLRMGKIRQMKETEDLEQQQALALRYQLISRQSSFILTFVRDDGDKDTPLPRVQHIRQMPAYGHGCYTPMAAAIGLSSFIPGRRANLLGPKVPASVATHGLNDPGQIEKLLNCWNMGKYASTSVQECLAGILDDADMSAWRHLVDELKARTGMTPDQIWAVILEFIWNHEQLPAQDRHTRRILTHSLKGVKQHDADAVRSRLKTL